VGAIEYRLMPLGTDMRKPPDERSNAIPLIVELTICPLHHALRGLAHLGTVLLPRRTDSHPQPIGNVPQPLRSSPRNDARAGLGLTSSGRASMVFWPKIRLACGAFPPRRGRSVSLGRYEEEMRDQTEAPWTASVTRVDPSTRGVLHPRG
jgi:hypothetical protein